MEKEEIPILYYTIPMMKNNNKLILLALVEYDHEIFHENTDDGTTRVEEGTNQTQTCKVRIHEHDLIAYRMRSVVGGSSNSSVAKKREKNDNKTISITEHANKAVCTGSELFHIILKKCHDICKGKELSTNNNMDNKNEEEYAEESIESNMNCKIIHDWSSFKVEIYHPKKCKFESLLHREYSNCDILNAFGNRIRCIISYEKKYDNCANEFGIADANECRVKAKMDLPQIMGRYFDYDPNGMDFAGQIIVVKERINNQIDGTGLNVWDGALLMALYFERMPQKIQSKTILELGSGTGFVGIASAILGAREVVITDLKYTMQLMQENVSLNINAIIGNDNNRGCLKIECRECDWFNPPLITEFGIFATHPQIILVADCVWVEELVDPLMNTLDIYCQEETVVIFTYQQRGKAAHTKFWHRLKTMFRSIVEVDTERVCGLAKPESLCLLECTTDSKAMNEEYACTISI